MTEDKSIEFSGKGENCIEQSNPPQVQQSKPRDGPATVFEADPMVSDIFACPDGDYFGLVLVTNWPPSPLADMDGPYQDFLGAVKSCFQEQDIVAPPSERTSSSGGVSLPAVYLYPTIHLHITVATFVPATKISGLGNPAPGPLSTNELREAKRAEALNLVQSASKLPGWPAKPLQLVVNSAQIGKRAGILLWKDLSGGIEAIRSCLKKASAEAQNTATPIIPGIIHSTFLRFSRTPQTPGNKVQEAFRSKVQGKFGKEFFHAATNKSEPLVVRANTVRLVFESTPYMHIPNDNKHVLWTSELAR